MATISSQRKPLTNTFAVAALATLCCALWGSAVPGVRLGYQLFAISSSDVGSQLIFAGSRFFFAGLAVLIVFRAHTHAPRLGSHFILNALELGAFQTYGQYVLYYIGLAHATGVTGSLIQGVGVFAMSLFSCFVFRLERMTVRKVLGGVLGFLGLIISMGIGASTQFGWGEALMLSGTICSTMATALMRQKSQHLNPIQLTGWQFVLGGIGLVLTGLLLGGAFTLNSWAAAGILAWLVFVSAAAFSIWSLLLRDNDISRIAPYQFFIPIFGVLISLLTLGAEGAEVGVNTVIALILISLGIIIVNRSPKQTS